MLSVALKLFAAEGYEECWHSKIVDAVNVTNRRSIIILGAKMAAGGVIRLLFRTIPGRFTPGAVYQGDITLTLERIAENLFRFAIESA